MSRSSVHTSRYQREQRFTVISWAVLALVGAVSAWTYLKWSSALSASADDDTSTPSAPTQSMHGWLDQSTHSIDDLVGARNNIAAAASHQDIPATGAACESANVAVANLRQHLPSPQPALNNTLQQAISSYTAGFPYCASAARTAGAKGLQRAASLISQGDTAMRSALDILGDASDGPPGTFGMLIV